MGHTYYRCLHCHIVHKCVKIILKKHVVMRISGIRFATCVILINFCGSDAYHKIHEILYTMKFYSIGMSIYGLSQSHSLLLAGI